MSIKHAVLTALTLVLGLVSMSSCIKDDISDCPTTGILALKVTFLNHTVVDRFEDEVTKVDFFIFDKDSLFVERVTDTTGPFKNGYTKELVLPFGDYRVVVWGNLYDDTELVGSLDKGVTTMDELQLKLVTSDTKPTKGSTQPIITYPDMKNFVAPVPTTLFWGCTDLLTVLTYPNYRVETTVDLLKDTHDIHVTLRWKDYDGVYCFGEQHQKITRAYIVGSNGDIKFDNSVTRERDLTYVPLYRDPAHPDIYAGQTGLTYIPPQLVIDGIAAVMPDYRTMRLMSGTSTEKIVVTTVKDDGTEEVVYVRGLVDLIQLTGHYNEQPDLDACNDYNIVIDFRCIDPGHDHGTSWVGITIIVNGWVCKEINAEI